jgi:hypothetical protein
MSRSEKHNQNGISSSLLSLAILLGGDSGFSEAIENGASMECLDDLVKKAAATVGFQFPSEKAKQQAYQTVFSRLGRHHGTTSLENPHAQRFLQLLQERKAKTKVAQRSRHNFARRMGIINKEPELQYPSHLKVIYLDRLPKHNIYPPFDHYIFEKPYKVLPPPVKIYERPSTYADKYHVLDESMLQCTIGEDESAIILDKDTKELVAIVVRDFVKSYYNSVEEWSSALVLDTLNRPNPALRNDPETAHLDVIEQAPFFGRVRHLHDKYKKADDSQMHNPHLCSLVGFFYSLVRGQLPIIASKFEHILLKSGTPRYDQHDSQKFTLPFLNGPTFQYSHLTPSDGYVSHNYSSYIHHNGYSNLRKVAIHWNISRKHGNRTVGRESGGNFFVADYGLRIINSTNSCVGWDASLAYGTSVPEDGLDQLIITLTAWLKD